MPRMRTDPNMAGACFILVLAALVRAVGRSIEAGSLSKTARSRRAIASTRG